MHVRDDRGTEGGIVGLLDPHGVRAGAQESHCVASRVVTAAGGQHVRVGRVARRAAAHRDVGVLHRLSPASRVGRHGARERSGRRRVDRTQPGEHGELSGPEIVVQKAPPDVEVDHDHGSPRRRGCPSRQVERLLDQGVHGHRAAPRPRPMHRRRGAVVVDDRRLVGVDDHADGPVLSRVELGFTQERGSAALQGPQVERSVGRRDPHPLPPAGRVHIAAGSDAGHIQVHARHRVIRERCIGEQHACAWLPVLRGCGIVLVAAGPDQEGHGEQAQRETSHQRSLARQAQ